MFEYLDYRGTVLSESPIPTRPSKPFERPKTSVARDRGIRTSARQFFHPYVLAFLALALAVGASGYGYKLSQYLQHAGVSKASPTHMWVDHRDDSVAMQAGQFVKPQRIPGLALFAILDPQVPRPSRDHVVVTPAPALVASVISSHIPFRAPPSIHSSMA
ncbi:hypothetical protein P8935_05610 [Telmatobacter sp. DSM 110680]|uniref:Uncharacterized protein n=1 Tax=Telmatobacter sp. DSM 110680 TaxID=3036704 RepID=A0AAU7DLW6_9BACT